MVGVQYKNEGGLSEKDKEGFTLASDQRQNLVKK